MKTYITRTLTNEDRLQREMWAFTFINHNGFILDFYGMYTRKSTRHAWECVTQWHRLDQRNNTMREPKPAPDEIKASVLFEARESICIVEGIG